MIYYLTWSNSAFGTNNKAMVLPGLSGQRPTLPTGGRFCGVVKRTSVGEFGGGVATKRALRAPTQGRALPSVAPRATRWAALRRGFVRSARSRASPEGPRPVRPRFGRDIPTSGAVAEAFRHRRAVGVDTGLGAVPGKGVGHDAEADDVDRQVSGREGQFLAGRTWPAAAGFVAIGHQHHDPRPVAVVQDLSRCTDRGGEWGQPVGIDRVNCGNHGARRIGDGCEMQVDPVARPLRPRTVDQQAHAAHRCDLRHGTAQRLAGVVDAGGGGGIEPDLGHRGGAVEDQHRIRRAA